jgi:hypothetical protein
MTKAEILTVEQVSSILGIHRNTIQRKDWRRQTGCPLRKIGKRLYCHASDFQKWIRGN